jgi:hypothetical protein
MKLWVGMALVLLLDVVGVLVSAWPGDTPPAATRSASACAAAAAQDCAARRGGAIRLGTAGSPPIPAAAPATGPRSAKAPTRRQRQTASASAILHPAARSVQR